MLGFCKDNLIGGGIACVGVCALGISFTIGTVTWGGESSRLFPLAVSVILIGLGVTLALSGVKAPPVKIKIDAQALQLICLMGLGILYVAAIDRLGYILPTAIAMPLTFFLFGVRSRLWLAASIVVGPLIYHLIFFVALNVYPPYAPWLDISILARNN